LAERLILVRGPGLVERRLHVEDRLLICSRTASSRRSTVIGRVTSRYFPRTYKSRSTSSAMPR
jgi:hypothetical protein